MKKRDLIEQAQIHINNEQRFNMAMWSNKGWQHDAPHTIISTMPEDTNKCNTTCCIGGWMVSHLNNHRPMIIENFNNQCLALSMYWDLSSLFHVESWEDIIDTEVLMDELNELVYDDIFEYEDSDWGEIFDKLPIDRKLYWVNKVIDTYLEETDERYLDEEITLELINDRAKIDTN